MKKNNSRKNGSTILEQGNENFDWGLYEGWNGKTLKANDAVKCDNANTAVYCHEPYAKQLYNAYKNKISEKAVSKELVKDAIVTVTDIQVLPNGEVIAEINEGMNNIPIDINKEAKFLSSFSVGGETLTKEQFVSELRGNPVFKKDLLNMQLIAKVGTKGEKASLSDGYIHSLVDEMKQQAVNPNKAYTAKVVSFNTGGLKVIVADTVPAFMPASAAGRLEDFESAVGNEYIVMVEKYDPKSGFVVSHRRYLRHLLPTILEGMQEVLEQRPDEVYTGVVTSIESYGLFVELDGYEGVTGMIHKTLCSDALVNDLRNRAESLSKRQMEVYIHSIDGTRLVLSDVHPSERASIIEKREKEEDEIRRKEAEARGETYVSKLEKREKREEKQRLEALEKLVEKYS